MKAKKIILIVIISIFVLIIGASLGIITMYSTTKLDKEKLTSMSTGVEIYDENSKTLDSYYNFSQKVVDINTLPDYVCNAFVSIEDKRFFEHNGTDFKRILKSVLVNLKQRDKAQGASTITQQLVKNTLLTPDKTYSRKIKEIILARKVEKAFTKEQILSMYLNSIYFGSNAYGLESASNVYFDKPASNLSIAESALLAGIIKSPTALSPKLHPDEALKRRNLVLNQMYEQNYITKDEYDSAKNEDLSLSKDFSINFANSYYQQALYEARKILNLTEKEFLRGNYKVYTYLRPEIQQNIINTLKSADYDGDKLIIVTSNNGKILGYLGCSDYDLINLKRQPASILKPLLVYAPAIENDLITVATKIEDNKTDFDGYIPNNADGIYHGNISVREAFSTSNNVVACKILTYLGCDKANQYLKQMNIDIGNDVTLSAALGATAKPISPISIIGGYLTLQNLGIYKPATSIAKILDKNSNVVYTDDTDKLQTRVFSEDTSYLTLDMMKTTAETGTAKRLNSLNKTLYSKTGTNKVCSNINDVYNVALSKDYLVFSWIGEPNNKGLIDITSGYHATNLSKSIFSKLDKSEPIKKPDSIENKTLSLIEYEDNNILRIDDSLPSRYTFNEIFKTSTHIQKVDDINFDFDIDLNRTGATISFIAQRNYKYKIYKKTSNSYELLKEINSKKDIQKVTDKNVFKFDTISYYIEVYSDKTKIYTTDEKVIKPKSYLMKIAENEILNNGKKYAI